MLDRDQAPGKRRGALQGEHGIARRLGRVHAPLERQREGAEPGEQVGDCPRPATASRTPATSAASPSRGRLEEGAGRERHGEARQA